MGYWHRRRLGNTRTDDNVVHCLYKWYKDDCMSWDTQCTLSWARRDNTDASLCPKRTKHPLTCIMCLTNDIAWGGTG